MNDERDWTDGGTVLQGQHCRSGHAWYLPRRRCPFCGGAAEWFEPSGRGRIFAATTVHRRADGGEGEIGIALVDLDEGIRIMARCAPGTTIGARVRVSPQEDNSSGRMVPACEAEA
ncbi:Zn-ribbon domain-containing OB-fold protein [Microbacterium sp. F2]